MNIQQLAILGLLKSGPKHGYEIKKQFKEVMGIFASINTESIYYPLQLLEQKGYIRKYKEKQGNRPERIVYSLTPPGEARFKSLLKENFLSLKRPLINLDLSLYFLPYIDKQEALRTLRIRKRALEKIKRWLESRKKTDELKESVHLLSILEHNFELVKAEIAFNDFLLCSLASQ